MGEIAKKEGLQGYDYNDQVFFSNLYQKNYNLVNVVILFIIGGFW